MTELSIGVFGATGRPHRIAEDDALLHHLQRESDANMKKPCAETGVTP